MKKVAVSQRVDCYPERKEFRDAVDQNLISWLVCAGYLPVPVPNNLFLSIRSGCVLDAWLSQIAPDAVLLSGGNDIGVFAERDRTEARLLDYAKLYKIPLLGICRGMQMMSVWSGAKLQNVNNHVGVTHEIHGLVEGEVNSYHNQVIESCPPDFDVIACSEDYQIEAIRHKSLPWEGWMWHPERDPLLYKRDMCRLNQLFG